MRKWLVGATIGATLAAGALGIETKATDAQGSTYSQVSQNCAYFDMGGGWIYVMNGPCQYWAWWPTQHYDAQGRMYTSWQYYSITLQTGYHKVR
jgi:hypothetical protein